MYISKEKQNNLELKKVLVVDDEEIIRELMGEILDMLGYEPILCGSPYEALELFRNQHKNISLVFLDMIMPELSGRQLFEMLSRIDPNKKIVILSGYSSEAKLLMDEGVSAYVQKPVSIKELSRVIKEQIG